jgi:hydroxymethylpyrimidine kinase/phosphomethylpyrimidine kinase
MRPVVLCFSGLDPSGGAGLQADIETIASLGGHAAVVCTALTVQDSNRVYGFEPVSPALLEAQARAVLADLPVAAIKIGMLGSAANAHMLGRLLADFPALPVVLDPVLAANSGGNLAGDELMAALLALLPQATLLTPNTIEARRLSGRDDAQAAVHFLRKQGSRHILLKGGHEPGTQICNRLYNEHGVVRESHWPRLPGEYHGSGCTLAAATALFLAQGHSLRQAVEQAETYVADALARADRPRASGQFLPVRVQP